MRSEWKYRAAIFVPAARIVAAKALANHVFEAETPERIAEEERTFAVELSDTGTGAPQFLACCGALTERAADRLSSRSTTVAEIKRFVWDAFGGALVDSNDLSLSGRLGEPWGWTECLAVLDLKEIATSE